MLHAKEWSTSRLALNFDRSRISSGAQGHNQVSLRLPTGASMNDATAMLAAIRSGDADATERLLVLVYDELRRLAAAKLAGEAAGQTYPYS
jgi:DNA-binding GntR family transcriptional regulator